MITGDVRPDAAGETACRLLLLQGLHRWRYALNRRASGLTPADWERVLGRLPAHLRAVVILGYLWEWPQQRIGEWLGLTGARARAAVSERLRTARQMLAQAAGAEAELSR